MSGEKRILIKNIYHMLSYAFSDLRQMQDQSIAKEEFENLHSLFAAILEKAIGRQLKRGLYRAYQNRVEELPVMRGKIDMPGTIRNRLARKQVLTCEYDELSVNNPLNQILKTTVMLLLRHANVEQKHKDALKKEMLFFSEVDTVDLMTVKWAGIRFQRNNQSYRLPISVCQLICEGMLLTTEQGGLRMAAFLDDQRMSRLYEKFIFEYYRQTCAESMPRLKVSASQIPWALDDGMSTMLPVMQSDVMLTMGKQVLIIDAKFYSRNMQVHYDRHTIHSNNLYQIFTYVKNQEASYGARGVGGRMPVVSGLLLYARTEDAIQPNRTYWMSGNRIGVMTLDLNCEFATIREQLDGIVEAYFCCV